MTPRPQKGPRLYIRHRGGQPRYYADLRSVGRGYVALIPDGEVQATTDPVVAQKMLTDLLEEIQEQKRDGALLGLKKRAQLQAYAAEHLMKKARSGKVTDGHLELSELHLREAVKFFGAGRDLHTIGVAEVQAYATHLSALSNGRGGTISPGTQRKYLNALSNLYRRAGGEAVVPPGYNPVASLMEKPAGEAGEAPWLEVWEAALLLEAARVLQGERTTTAGERLASAIEEALGRGLKGQDVFVQRMRAAGFPTTVEQLRAYVAGERIPTKRYVQTAAGVLGVPEDRLWKPRGWNNAVRQVTPAFVALLHAFLLTGGRESEVLGLELRDVNLKTGVVHFRPTRRRRLKTSTSRRTVPLWPQLREVLEPHLETRRKEGGEDSDLLFPSPRTGGMITDLRKALDAVAGTVGWLPGEIRTKAFRHAYCAARLQTLDRGHPVSVYTVARELGHGGETMVKRVYGHLGQVRHRSEVVEYRLEQQREEIPPERLRLLLRAV